MCSFAIERNERAEEEIQPPYRGDVLIDAKEQRRIPELPRHLLARILDGEWHAGEQRSPGNRHQCHVDEQRHMHRKKRPPKSNQSNYYNNKKDEGDGIKKFQRSPEHLPHRCHRGNGERQRQNQEEPPVPQTPSIIQGRNAITSRSIALTLPPDASCHEVQAVLAAAA